MALDWDLASQAQLAGDLVKPVILFRLSTTPVIRLASTVVPKDIAADLVEDVDGSEYTALGELLDPPQFNSLFNGLSERVDFVLAGAAVDGEVALLAASDADAIRGKAINVGFFVCDDNGQQLSPTAWLWDGIADTMAISRDGQGESATRTITLSAGSVMTGRQRPYPQYWTDPDQRRRSADDAICSQIKLYFGGSTKSWPK